METSCGLVLANGDLVLLLRYPQGHWGFPKGHVEDTDASPHDTALRELREETGIDDAKVIGSWSQTTQYTYPRRGVEREKQVHWFPAKTKTFDVVLSHEHTDHMWVEIDEAADWITFPAEKEVLRGARRILGL